MVKFEKTADELIGEVAELPASKKFVESEWKAREKFSDFCKDNGGLVYKNATYCKIIKPIKQVDIQLVKGEKEWIAEFVGLE